ncbi:MAG: UxaA family hydrolase [Desulfobacterales bacterium]|nr:UxaA family hydrolase [Desulfobacterales bacterium]
MIEFLIHEESDSVGVATVDIKAGQTATGLYMDSQAQVTIDALDDIPLGHKLAMIDHRVDDSVIKYGSDIGKVVAEIKKGGHVHTQNLKTRRW